MQDQATQLKARRKPLPDDQVRASFGLHSFMPLPLFITRGEQGRMNVARVGYDIMALAIMYDSELAPPAVENGEVAWCCTLCMSAHSQHSSIFFPPGFILTPQRTELIIEGWFDMHPHTRVKSICEVSGASPSSRLSMVLKHSTALQVLKVNGVVNITEQYALCVFQDERKRRRGALAEGWQRKATRCQMLYRLNQESALPFRLEDLIQEVADLLELPKRDPSSKAAIKKEARRVERVKEKLRLRDAALRPVGL